MTERQPRTTELDQRFSSPQARATPWDDARSTLTDAKIYWLATIRDDLRPHVTPLIGCSSTTRSSSAPDPPSRRPGTSSRTPIARSRRVATPTRPASTSWSREASSGLSRKRACANWRAGYVDKYGDDWRFEVGDAAFHHEGGEAWVFEVVPTVVFGFQKGDAAGQTRWRFSRSRCRQVGTCASGRDGRGGPCSCAGVSTGCGGGRVGPPLSGPCLAAG